MGRVVYTSLGRASSKVVVGPQRGVDNAVVSVAGRTAMLITTDPISIIPAVGMRDSAWLSVHLIASDYATSGLRPEFATFTYNFPGSLRSSEVEEYIRAMGRECEDLGVSIVAGHTGSYPGGGFTVVGSGTMLGFSEPGGYVDPTMARPGDSVLMTKGAAVEATAMLAWSFPRFVERKLGRELQRRAKLLLKECSTVKDALAAASLGLGKNGVTSMHDATEGGVLGGLAEMADASGNAFSIEQEKVHILRESSAVCSLFGIDPLTAVGEGSLLVTCALGRAGDLKAKLKRLGIPLYEIGRVKKGRGLWMSSAGGKARRLGPAVDRYWSAYARATRAHLR